jgi:hypothetical protein
VDWILLAQNRVQWRDVLKIMCHVDPLLGGDREIGDYRGAVARQRLANNREMMFSALSVKQQLNSKRGTVFSVGSMPRCYKQDN